MALTVREEVLNRTTRCSHDFGCLSSEGFRICPAERFEKASNVLYVLSGNGNPCPYHFELSNTIVCGCPVRKDLHKHYGL
jgi:hypothetical protein